MGLRSTQGVPSSAFNANLHAALTTPVLTPTANRDTFSFTNATIGNQLGLNWRENVGNFALDTTTGTQTLTANTGLAFATLNGVSQADVVVSGSAKTLPVGQWAGLGARYSGVGDTNMYWAALTVNIDGTGTAVIYRNLAGTWTLLSSRNIGFISGTQNLHFEVVSDSLKFFVNNAWAVSASDSALTTGSVGIQSTQGAAFTGTPIGFTASLRIVLTVPASPVSVTDDFSTGYDTATNSQTSAGRERGLVWKDQVGAFDVNAALATGLASLNLATINAAQADARITATGVVISPNHYFGLMARYSGSGDSDMYWEAVGFVNGRYTTAIYNYVGGTCSLLGIKNLSSFGGLIEFEAIGSSLTLKTDGVTAVAVTDTSISSGKSGIRITSGVQVTSFTTN